MHGCIIRSSGKGGKGSTMAETTQPMSVPRLCAWLMRYAFRRWAGFLVVIGTMLLGILMDLLKPWPMAILVDHVLKRQPVPDSTRRLLEFLPGADSIEGLLVWSVSGTVVLFLLSWALNVANSYAGIGFGQSMVYDLAADLFAHLQRLSLGFHSRRRLGDSIRRVTTDCSCVSTIIRGALLPVLGSVVTLVTMFGVMYRLSPGLTLLAMAVVPLMAVAFARYAKPMLELSYAQSNAEGQLYDVIEETLSAMPVIQAFSREERGERRYDESVEQNMATLLAATNVQVKFKILIGLASALGTAGILWMGTHQALAGKLTVGNILVFISYLGALYGPLNSLMYTSSAVQGASAGARRVREILDTEHEVKERAGAITLEDVKGRVQFEKVTFGYESGRPFLRDVSVEAAPGETIAVVGPTGAGKSTLLSLIPRLYDPWEGRILIDGNDVRDVELRSLRQNVSLVLQEAFLFPISIADNIAYGRPEASREEIIAAARASNAHPFIERLPNGYDTVVGERGATLSGGERQRVSIARALLKDAPILILDEPTSALDAVTESLLLEALERLMKGRTTFIIAHRLSTIRNANRILVMENGFVVESGTHEELLAAGGTYAGLHAIQFGNRKQGA